VDGTYLQLVWCSSSQATNGSKCCKHCHPYNTKGARWRQWFRFVHIGFFHVLIGANILLTRPDWFCLLDCHDKHRVLMGEPTICTSLLWVLEILNRHYCLLQRGR
jgi:hypothetical protein